MKRIVILCDGTWNAADMENPTNVVHFSRMMKRTSDAGVAQVPVYVPGVGTGEGVTKLSRRTDRLVGGLFGWGLLENIAEAYRHLVFVYEPGDEIYVLGFSRGAYTARSLTGLVRSTGILDRGRLDRLPEAIARYRDRDPRKTHPNTEASHRFRAEVSPGVATSERERDWRRENRIPEGHLLRVAFLGVWDTVGALGVPQHFSVAGYFNRGKYQFHDTNLSGMVATARHAVALDEKRKTFKATGWDNLDDLNREADPSGQTLPFQERYFAGDHGSVGGGGEIVALSHIGLNWMVEGAQDQGLEFHADAVEAVRAAMNHRGPLRNTTRPPRGFTRLLLLSQEYRSGPSHLGEVHPSAVRRWREDPGYRPGSLKRVRAELDSLG